MAEPKTNKMKLYRQETVLQAARARMRLIFDAFDQIVVCVSGGKDSTALGHLALTEARRRGRRVGVLFIDAEIIHAATVQQVRDLLGLYPENVTPYWLQVPYQLPNATSLMHPEFTAWDPAARGEWMRPMEPYSIQCETWNQNTRTGSENHLAEAFRSQFDQTAFLVGIRADESMHRYNAVTRNPGYEGVLWSSKAYGGRGNVQFYPLYDWSYRDVWRYIAGQSVPYNRIYDYQWALGIPIRNMRISSLLHQWAGENLVRLPEFEPHTYDRLLRRVPEAEFGALYGHDDVVRARRLPAVFSSWRQFRDHLLDTYPVTEIRETFRQRFAGQSDDERTAQQQCRQLLAADTRGWMQINTRTKQNKEATKAKWKALLS